MTISDLFSNEEALRTALANAMHDAAHAAATAAATAKAEADAFSAHNTAKAQLVDALNVPVDATPDAPPADPSPAAP